MDTHHHGAMDIFEPLTDDMLECGDFDGELVPYQPGYMLISHCETPEPQSRCSTSRSPADTPNSAALPALSSRTY